MTALKKETAKDGKNLPRWDLSHLYKGLNDPQINKNIADYVARCKTFEEKYKGKLSVLLGEALTELTDMEKIVSSAYAYAFLVSSTDASNKEAEILKSRMAEQFSAAGAHMVFFSLEIADMDDGVYENLLKSDEIVARHKPYVDDVRKGKPYNLSAEVERALTIRAPFGSSEWSDFIDEQESLMTFAFEGEDMTMPDIFNILQIEKNSDRRAAAMKVIYETLRDKQLHSFMGRAYNAIMGEKMVEDMERGYTHPMHSRNLQNKVSQQSVDALHKAVATVGAEQCQRFYKLKAKLMGEKVLRWSDRNAPLEFQDTTYIAWEECMDIVKKAYASFSPKLAELVTWIENQKMIDVPTAKGKRSGAYDYTFETPNGIVSYNFLNYTGSTGDVMTTAHELGHGVHGILAHEAQGVLMADTPMNYAETASIFGEMVTFNHVLAQTEDKQARLSLLMDKLNDFMNSVVRQISFSDFEVACHNKRREGKLKLDDYDAIWMDVTRKYYGENGEVFTYENMDNMWCYVGHFLRPFYVYAYAFGELFTQSLFAVQNQFGDKFEPMYLDLLRAGGTKDAVELMQPFGLNPNDATFWQKGIEVSAKAWLDEAEQLVEELKL